MTASEPPGPSDDTRPVVTPRLRARHLALDVIFSGARTLPSDSQPVLLAIMRWAREDYRAGATRQSRDLPALLKQRRKNIAVLLEQDADASRPELAVMLCRWIDEDESAGRARLLSATFPAVKP